MICWFLPATHWQQNCVLSCDFLQSQSDGNAATFASKVRLNLVDMTSGFCGSLIMRVVGIFCPRTSTVSHVAFHLVGWSPLSPFLVQVVDDVLLNLLRFLIRHSANREFSNHLSRDNSLLAGFTKGTFDAVKWKWRIAPTVHEQSSLFLFVHQLGCSNVCPISVNVECDLIVHFVFIWQQWCNFTIDVRNKNSPVLVDESSHQVNQVGHSFVNCSTEDARVKIFYWALDFKSKVANAAKTVSDAWLSCSKPVIVGNANVVNSFEPTFTCVQKIIQALTAAFFHSFEDKLDVDWNFQSQLLIAFYSMNPSKNWSLVIARSTSVKFSITFSQNERLSVPTVFDQSWLHIKMTVNDDRLLSWILKMLATYLLSILFVHIE